MKKIALFFLFLPLTIFVIEHQPWFGNIYEFNLLSRYTYSYYSSVDSSKKPLGYTSHDHLVYFGLEFPTSSVCSIDGDIEFTDTPRQSFSFRSTALQGRYLIYDDIIGDKLSMAIGGNLRFTSSRSLKDVSTPYYANCDFEATLALGKEFESESFRSRLWGVGCVGLANKGSPWVSALISLEGNSKEVHKGSIFLAATHGYGRKTVVNINHFYGYGNIRVKNLDLGARYGHRFGVWGTLSVEYVRRLYAKRCPKEVNFFSICYLLPFSF
jgi:hypothetical protein